MTHDGEMFAAVTVAVPIESLTRLVDDYCSDGSTNRIYRAGEIKLTAITGGAACVVCVYGGGVG